MATPGNYQLDYSNINQEHATAGDIKNGAIFNTSSVGSIGTVKLLALGAIGWLLYKIFGEK